ncbi:MAG: PTS sugar transporter subunit IIA [Anaerolineales bacterium]|nr:PTS sugar transporter subunit IIA [Anaerolineales bacterium]MCW5839136.1 PTS sugar transporter subunit IIA [Anaerolineales bacterium]
MSIFDLLAPEAIHLNVEAQSAEEVIRSLGGGLQAAGKVKDGFVEATLERERNMPTGLALAGEYNAALPHVDLEYVESSALALATLSQPVSFRNMVNKEEEVAVRLVVMLALNDPKSQIEALGQVAVLLQNPRIVARLVAASDVQDVQAALQLVDAAKGVGR